MFYRSVLAACSGVIFLAACGDSTAPSAEPALTAAPQLSIAGTERIPISFVTQFASFDGGETRTNGASGRSQSHFCLSFTVQEGDLEGTMYTCFSANDPSDQTASQGPNGFFTSTVPDLTEYQVCMPATGWCGTFSETASIGKVYPLPRGVEFKNAVALGGGDFDGMQLKGTVYECPDSQGDRGCFSGYLLVPGTR